jgi:osmotically-inducible protein OsmY
MIYRRRNIDMSNEILGIDGTTAILHHLAFHRNSSLEVRPRQSPLSRWMTILLILAGMPIPLERSAHAATTPKTITDHGITFAVERGLIFEKGVFPSNVDVNTSEGIVTLSGAVSNLLAKERALKIAQSIRGVRGVIDRITVTPVARPDADIRKDILAALRQDPATSTYKVDVSVKNATATLSGSVGSYTEEQLAARIAKGVKGIKEIRNDVRINYLAKRTDLQIAADIKARLQWDIWINGDQIASTVKDGKVTLTGTIGSALGKSRAFDDAWVNGVVSVDDSSMKVEPSAGDGGQRKLKYVMRSDSEIKQAVQAALGLDPRVAAFSPDVNVESGIVILGGTVGNLKAKSSAEQDVRNTAGVQGIENLLKVRPNGHSTDAEIKEQLKAVLLWDPLLDSTTIDVAVIDHVAYLSGSVASNFQKSEVEDVASRTKGVVLAVLNHLKVEPEFAFSYYAWPDYLGYGWPYYDQSPYYISEVYGPQAFLSDGLIKRNIEDGFFWSPFVHSKDIKVSVDGGVATLTGTVGTWIAWGEADKDARRSGATAVHNQVKVKEGTWRW